MSRTAHEENLQARAELFRALGHPMRLLILNLVQLKPRHGEELATLLNLQPATVSHHVSKLTSVGLLQSRKDQYYQVYTLAGDVLERTIGDVVRLPQPGLKAEVEEDAYRDKVLKAYFRRGQLVDIPRQLKKRLIILEELVKEFEPDRTYAEHEVNQILLEFNEDFAYLRRGLVDHKLMTRDKGIYRRLV